ncbi:MAG: hypothetical protein KAR79_04955 [Simkaniaceae bacterium]|nr:hypothetical protein [Simkaniaceae bacterium]
MKQLPILDESLYDLLSKAGEATDAPKVQKGGIPKSHVPAWMRWTLQVTLVPFIWMDVITQKIAKKIIRPPFKKQGKCKRRGNCCHYILIRADKGIISRFFVFFCTQVYGFFLRDTHPHEYEGKQMLVMGCRYLKKDGSCSHYHLRPTICRQWPIIESFAYPQILKGCGYRSDPPFVENNYKENPLHIIQD